jgi:hypothetical protein
MVTPDYSELIIQGNEHPYTYVLEMPPTLVQSLTADFRNHLIIQIGDYDGSTSVVQGGKFTTRVQTRLTSDASEQEKEQAIRLGYQTSSSGRIYYNHTIGSLHGPSINLRGKRYAAGEFKPTVAPVAVTVGQIDPIAITDGQKNVEQSNALLPVIVLPMIVLFVVHPWTILLVLPWGLRN